jgi:capsular polysaccharide biosynthesis protein
VLAAAVAAAFLPAKTYEATSTIAVVPVESPGVSAATQTQYAEYLIPIVMADVESRDTEAAVRAELTGAAKTGDWEVSSEAEPNSPQVITIVVRGGDAQALAQVADAYAARAIGDADKSKGVQIRVLEKAEVPDAAVAPNPPLLILAGLVLGVLVGLGVALLLGDRPRTSGAPVFTAAMGDDFVSPMATLGRQSEPVKDQRPIPADAPVEQRIHG